METIILRGHSKTNARLLLQLADKLQFSGKTLSASEEEELGIAISIHEGLQSGLI